MPRWKWPKVGENNDSSEEGSPQSLDDDAITGSLPCNRYGCQARNAAPCAYVDRRDKACETAWCPEHQLVLARKAYCLRHGGVMRAVIAASMEASPLPDLDNRAASLVQFVAEGMNEDIVALLKELTGSQYPVRGDSLALMFVGRGRRRTWQRKWAVYSHTGDVMSLIMAVAEDQDSVITIRANSEEILQSTPPWITDRAKSGDVAARQSFYNELLTHIKEGIEGHRHEYGGTSDLSEVLAALRR